MKELKDGLRALVRLDFQGRVHKTYRGSGIQERYDQEVAVLKILEERQCPYVPRLLEEHPEEHRIVTTSCGAPAPQLTQKKATELFDALRRDYGIEHDDPEPRNVTYSGVMGRFCLIDFELATIHPLNEGAAEHVPKADATWKVRWQATSHKGSKHTANDDFYSVLGVSPEDAVARPANSEHLLDPEHTLLAVSDGMGGRNAGELASHLILAWLRKRATMIYPDLAKNPEHTEPLREALDQAHRGLNELAADDAQIKGMGATLTSAYITPGHLTMAHIGDSRLYLFREGETKLLSADHSVAFRDWQAGKISEYAYRNHPRRAALYDSLGGGHQGIHPQFLHLPLQHRDRLLLCTDGIVDGLWEKNIHQEISRKAPIEEIAERLLLRARANDGSDDCTLIVADISQI